MLIFSGFMPIRNYVAGVKFALDRGRTSVFLFNLTDEVRAMVMVGAPVVDYSTVNALSHAGGTIALDRHCKGNNLPDTHLSFAYYRHC